MAGLRATVTPGPRRVEVFRAPWSWGPSDGTTAGELFRIAYTGEAPDSAELELSDGRIIPLTIEAGLLSGLLPPDTPAGRATVRTTGRRAHTLIVSLQGVSVVVEPTGPPAPGTRIATPPRIPPARRQPAPRRTIRHRSTLVLQTSATTIRTIRRDETAMELRAWAGGISRTPPPPPRLVQEDIAIELSELERLRTVQPRGLHPSVLAIEEIGMQIRRRDGPALEEQILLAVL